MSSPQIYLADDGSVQEVLDSKTLTVEELDERIANAQDHVNTLQSLRDRVVTLTTGSAPAAAEPAAPAAGGVELTVTPAAPVDAPAPANADAGQVPVAPAQVPGADTGAFNNGQVDPAAASNPTAPVAEVPAATAAAPAAEPSVPQPVISA